MDNIRIKWAIENEPRALIHNCIRTIKQQKQCFDVYIETPYLHYLMKEENAIYSAVEYDNNQFWKLVKKNK